MSEKPYTVPTVLEHLAASPRTDNEALWVELGLVGDSAPSLAGEWPTQQNWAGNQRWRGVKFERPANRAALAALVASAHGPVGIVGYAGAWSPLLTGCDVLIDLANLNKVTRVADSPAGKPRVRAEAGVSMGALDEALKELKLCMPTSTVIPFPTVGGVLATGAHGTGKDRGIVADYAVAMEVMGADGQVSTYDTKSCEWPALTANLGACGVVLSVTFEVEHLHHIFVQDVPDTWPVDRFMNPDIVRPVFERSDLLELFWWPTTDKIWLKRGKRTQEPVRGSIQAWLNDRITVVGGKLTLPYVGAHLLENPHRTPEVLGALRKLVLPLEAVVDAPHAYHYQRVYPSCWDMCYAIPIGPNEFDKVVDAWMYVVSESDSLTKARDYAFNLSLHARWLAPSRAWMSPTFGDPSSDTHFLMIEILTFKDSPPGWMKFFEKVEKHWASLGGVPHWAKCFSWGSGAENSDPEWSEDRLAQIKLAYGARLKSFREVRHALDPHGKFLSPFVRRLVGE